MKDVKYTLYGPIPEKNFILTRTNGELKQSEESKEWEADIKKLMQAEARGWISQSDPEYGEYTPLQAIITIHTPKKTILVKQIKALLDALTGVMYMDDCSIVDLTAERKYSEQEYTELYFRPADKKYIRLPDGEPVSSDRFIRPIKNTAFEDGHPLDKEKYDGDIDWRKHIRAQFHDQKKQIEGEYELDALLGTGHLNDREPLKKRLAAYRMDFFPITMPDLDNCCYAILNAVNGGNVLAEDCTKFHLIKKYYDPATSRNKFWLYNRS